MYRIVDVTLSADTSIFGSGDVISDTEVISGLCLNKNRACMLKSLMLLDEDDQGVALDIYFFSANVSMGTENSTPSLTDANSRSLLGVVPIATGDYKDLGGTRVAIIKNIDMLLKPATDTQDVYVATVNGSGTPTFTVSGLKLRLGIDDSKD